MNHELERDNLPMEHFCETNDIRLCGSPAGRPVYSHSSRGQDFYLLPLRVERLSGTEDLLNLTLRQELLERADISAGQRLWVAGELRSFNNHRDNGPRLVLTVFVRDLSFCDLPDENRARLRGTVCKPPTLRRTPLGREICDLMLAVNRHYGRSDYLPCICWGSLARQAALFPVGQRIRLEGRLQSREYRKLTEDGPQTRTAYEVSAMELEAEDEAE